MARGLTETLAETLTVFHGADGWEPMTTADVAESLGVSTSEVADRLADLEHRGALASKRLQGAGRIWWPVQDAMLSEADAESGAGSNLKSESEAAVAASDDGAGRPDRDGRLERRYDDLPADLDEVLDRVSDGFYALDGEFRFTYVNERAAEILQASPEELLGERVWEQYPEATESPAWDAFHEALETQEQTGYEVYFEPLESWIEASVYPSENGLSVHFQDVTERVERELELERRVRQQAAVTGLGQYALERPDLDDLFQRAVELVAETLDNEYAKVLELHPDDEKLLLRRGVGWDEGIVGSATVASDENSQAGYTLLSEEPVIVEDLGSETRFRGPPLLEDHGAVSGISVVVGSLDDPWGVLGTHDTERREFTPQDATFLQSVANVLATAIDRHRYERQLEQRREELSVLDDLNGVVRSVTAAVVEQSTRAEIEQVVCETIAAADAYEFAWVARVDPASGRVEPTAEAGAGDYVDAVEISSDPDDQTGQGPTGRAIQTREMQVVRDVDAAAQYEPWRDAAKRYGFTASAAIPITHDGTLYGVLNVYAGREDAFADAERDVVGQIGEVVGHAIAAVERKRALMGDEVVEVEFAIGDVFADLDLPEEPAGVATVDRTVPIGDGDFLVFGSATDDGLATLRNVADALPQWESVTVLGDGRGQHRFELRLSEPPLFSAVASRGGRIGEARIEGGDLHLSVQLPPSVDVRGVVEAIKESYPATEMVTRQQVTRDGSSQERMERVLEAELTDRQRGALEAAYAAGFFEWPRDATGEEVADALGVTAPTFHQHVRTAERKLLASLFERTAG